MRENKFNNKDLNESYDFHRENNKLCDFGLSPKRVSKQSPSNSQWKICKDKVIECY